MAALLFPRSSSRLASRKLSSKSVHRACTPVVESLERRALLSMPTTFNPVGVGGTGAVWWPQVNPQNVAEVYATTDMGQVWHTTNASGTGTSWTTPSQVAGGSSLSVIQYSGIDGTAFGVGRTYDAGGNGISRVMKTTDRGTTWTPASGWDAATHTWAWASIQIQADPTAGSQKLVVAENGPSGTYRVWFSANGGTSFTKITAASHETQGDNPYSCYLAGSFWDGQNIYFATNLGVYRSTDGGANWAAYAPGGINFATDGIESFTGSRSGTNTRLYAITWRQSAFQGFSTLNTLGSGLGQYSGIYSSDNGGSWTSRAGSFWGPSGANLYPQSVCMISNDIANVWVSGGDANNYGTPVVYRADDGGMGGTSATWTRLFKTGYGSWASTEQPNQNIKTDMVGTGSEHYDWGWTGMPLSMTANWNPAYPSDPTKAVLAIADVDVFYSADGGTNWKSLMAPEGQLTPAGQVTNNHKYVTGTANETNVYHYAWTDPQNVFAACTDFTGMQSNNGGMSWMVPTYGASTFANTYYDVVYDWRSGYLYAVTSNAHDLYKNDHFSDGYAEIYGADRVVVSYDRGQSWNLIHDFGATVTVKSLALDPQNPNRLFVALASHHDTQWSDQYGTYLPGGIYYTNDLGNGSGSTWTRLAHQPTRDIGAGPEFVGGRGEELHVLNNGDLVGVFTLRTGPADPKNAGIWVLPHDAAGSPDINGSWIDASGNLNTNGNLPNNRLPYYTIGLTVDPNDPTQNTWYATTMTPGTGWYSCAVYKGTYNASTHTVNWTTWLSGQNPVAPLEYTNSQPWKILIRPGTTEMFMAMNYTGVYYTSDYTVANPTFTHLDLPFGMINNLAIDTFDPDRLWIGTYGAGAFWADISTTAPRPSAVSGVSGSSVGGTVTVNWNAVAGVSGYRVQYTDNSRSGDNNDFAKWTSVNVPAGTTNWSSSSLPYGSYYFRVLAYNASGVDGPISNYAFVPKYGGVPITSATGASTSSIVLKWTDNAVAETSFDVQYSSDGVNWAAAPSVGAGAVGTTVSGLAANTQYWFRVRAVNGSSSGDWSNPTVAGRTNNLAGLSVAESFEYPLANLGTSANQGLGWAGPWTIGNPGSANPQVLSGSLSSGGLWNAGNRLSITTEDNLSRTLASPIGGSGTLWASYLLKVDFSGGTTWSGGMSVNGTAFGVLSWPNTQKFSVVNGSANLYADSGVQAVAGQTYLLVLKITSGSTDTVDLYINPNPGDAAPSEDPGVHIIHRTGVTHIAGGTSVGLSHAYYAVPNFDEIRIGANYSDVAPLPVPASPTSPAASGQPTQIVVTWTDASSNEAGFHIQRATDTNFTQGLTTFSAAAGAQSYTDTTASGGVTYYYRVSSYNNTGDSICSAVVSASLTPITGLVASDGFGGYTIGALNGQGAVGNGWAGSWVVTGDSPSSTTVVSGDITPPVGLQVSGNARGSLGNNGSAATRTLSSPLNSHGSTLWASALLTTNWDRPYLWGSLTVGNVTVQYHDRTGNQDYEWTISGADGTWWGGTWGTGAMPAANNTSYFIVVKQTFSGGSDSVRVWINPTPGATAPSDASAFDSKSSVNVGGSLSTIRFAGTYYANTQFDEVRLGTTYSDVAPLGVTAPTAPANLAATATSQTQIDLSWTDNSSNETGFYLDRATDSGFSANLLTTTLAADVTTSSAIGLTANTTYYFRVRAYNGAGSSTNSNTASATTQVAVISDGFAYAIGALNGQGAAGNGWAGGWTVTGDSPANTTVASGDLAAPVGLAVSGNAHGSLGSTNSTATRNTSGSLSSYGSTIWASALIQTHWTGVYQWGSLSIGNVTVQYRDFTGNSNVEWTMNANDGSWYGTSFNTGATPADNNTTYFVVMKMTYNGGSDSVRVWLNPAPGSTPPLDAASFDYKAGVNAGGTLNSVVLSSKYYANMQVDELRIGTTYADVAPVGTLQNPSAPSALTASASSSSQINLTWTDSASNENGFYIDRATDSGFTANLVTTSVAANVTSYSATPLIGGAAYYFRVRAYNGAGSSANSNTASAATMAAPAMPVGLKALWRLDEGSGTSANDTDTDGTANTATLYNTPTWGTGKVGKALTLNGTNRYLQAANNADLNISGTAFSAAMWVKSGAANWNSTQTFISKGNGYKFGGVSGGKNIQFSLYIGGAWRNLTYTNSSDISTNWHHYAATYDGANMRIWMDGSNVASMAQTGSIASNTSVLYMGRLSNSYLNGSVDEVRVYNSVLTSTDVTNLYNQAALSVTSLTVNSGNSASYSVQNYALAAGISQYGDQTRNFTTIPSKYLGSTLIRTAFADNTSTASSLLSFTINQPILLYVAFDDAITSRPAWLTASFTDTSDNIVTAQGTFSVYKLAVSSGTITLGGPGGLASQGMYNVFYQNLL